MSDVWYQQLFSKKIWFRDVLKLFNSVCETKLIRLIKYGYSCFKHVVKWTIFVLGPVNTEVGDPK